MKTTLLAPLFLASLLATLTGCTSLSPWLEGAQPLEPFIPVNFRGEARLAADLQRVAILPLHGGGVAEPEITAVLDPVLVAALQREARFEVVMVSREDCQHLFGSGDFSSTAALPPGFLEKIAQKYAVDAVLFTDLTVFHAYRPVALGLRAKLATIRDVRLVWAFDELFSAADARMVDSVREYYRDADRLAPVDATPAVLQSPARFGAVAAGIMFHTLPPR